MAVDENWPHVSQHNPSESEHHVELKNLAVRWLLERGFRPEEIEDEHCVYSGGKPQGYTDIFADNGAVRVYVECERWACSPRSMSRGGQVPAGRGEAVYVFRPDGLYVVEQVERTLSNPAQASTWKKDLLEWRRVGPLPEYKERQRSD